MFYFEKHTAKIVTFTALIFKQFGFSTGLKKII